MYGLARYHPYNSACISVVNFGALERYLSDHSIPTVDTALLNSQL